MNPLDLLSAVHSLRWPLGLALLLGGCVSQGDWPETEREVSAAVGLSESVHFEAAGGPADLPDPAPATLTLAEAAEQALRTSPSLQSALARVRWAQADARQSRLIANPILSVAVRYPEAGGKPTIEAGLAGDLIALVQRPGRARAADDRLRAASAEAVSAALDVLEEVQQRYVAVQALDELMPVLEARRKLLDRLLDVARSRLRAGEGTQLDVITLESQRIELDLEIAEKLLERREERLTLTRLVGRPSGAAEWKLTPFDTSEPVLGPESEWIASALEHRPEIQARRWELAALGGDLAAVQFTAVEGSEAGAEAERDGDWSFGPAASAPLPLFDWGHARRAKVRADQAEARHKLTQQQRVVIEEARRAHAAHAGVVQALIQARDGLVPLAQKRLEQAEGQYLAGLTDITALVLAEQDLQAARARWIELQRRAASARYRLERAVGGGQQAGDGRQRAAGSRERRFAPRAVEAETDDGTLSVAE